MKYHRCWRGREDCNEVRHNEDKWQDKQPQGEAAERGAVDHLRRPRRWSTSMWRPSLFNVAQQSTMVVVRKKRPELTDGRTLLMTLLNAPLTDLI